MAGNPEQFGYPIGEDGCINFIAVHANFEPGAEISYPAIVKEMLRIIADYDNEVMPILVLNDEPR